MVMVRKPGQPEPVPEAPGARSAAWLRPTARRRGRAGLRSARSRSLPRLATRLAARRRGRAGRAAARPGPVRIPHLGGAGRHPGQEPASEKPGTLCVETERYAKLGSICNFSNFRPRFPGHAPPATGAGGDYRGIPTRSPRPWSGPTLTIAAGRGLVRRRQRGHHAGACGASCAPRAWIHLARAQARAVSARTTTTVQGGIDGRAQG